MYNRRILHVIAAAEPDKPEDMMMTHRSKSWRRFQHFLKDQGKKSHHTSEWKPEKNWKLLYTRSVKLQRAKKLGNEYPKKTVNQILELNE